MAAFVDLCSLVVACVFIDDIVFVCTEKVNNPLFWPSFSFLVETLKPLLKQCCKQSQLKEF